jgi:hypothetical protein
VTGTSAHTSTLAGPGGDPDTTVTFAVTSGLLTLTAPGSANLGTGRPGTTISGALGQMTVTDDRAALVATWTVTASLTNFTTGTGATLSTIPATDADYDAGEVVTTGVITVPPPISVALSGTPTPVVEGTAGRGNNTASWNPLMGVDVPPAAVGGTYTGTLTQSVA